MESGAGAGVIVSIVRFREVSRGWPVEPNLILVFFWTLGPPMILFL